MVRRRTLYLPVMIAADAAVACLVALLTISQKSEATFPGKNGKIAFVTLTCDFSGRLPRLRDRLDAPGRDRPEATHRQLTRRHGSMSPQRAIEGRFCELRL